MSPLRGGGLRWRGAVTRAIELERATKTLGVDAAFVLRTGNCAEAILAAARAHAADTIVVGTHLRPGLARGVHRRVATSIIEAAAGSVLVEPVLDTRRDDGCETMQFA
jgi:nucleotide-binding universal stress UspA family protein